MSYYTAFVNRAMALSDPAWASKPIKREIVFPTGKPPGNDGRPWHFTPEDLAGVVADFKQRTEPIPVYFRHQEDPAKGSKAAGWISGLSVEPDGLYADIRYTDEALNEIRDGAWAFRSPGFEGDTDEEGYVHPRRLMEVSLVNEPAIGGMPPLQASTRTQPLAVVAQTATEPVTAAADSGEFSPQEVTAMGDTKPIAAAKQKAAAFDKAGLLALVRDAYAMPDAVSDEMLLELIDGVLEGPAEGTEPPDTPGNMPAIPGAEADPPPPPVQLEAKRPRIELAESDESELDVVSVLAEATAAGKVVPANAKQALALAKANAKAFRAWLETAPVIAPPAGRTVVASKSDRRSASQPSTGDQLTQIAQYASRNRTTIAAARAALNL